MGASTYDLNPHSPHPENPVITSPNTQQPRQELDRRLLVQGLVVVAALGALDATGAAACAPPMYLITGNRATPLTL
jgi:hypothetical protein